ncbi:heterokaryon incompatibility protein-domain-containing protein [Cladorrhinum samala]|uniref:Heterokaryon incompatibility protein-domain-containing protein n=1 Tax=Cladorrhinum samala TaxID=585594 RepID=A0AAV9HDS9_9PEZI|nr:heterokaryon incompatibility protein-domain-containing protein [Cladorrhinum samala]
MDFTDDTDSALALLSRLGFNIAAQSGQILCWVCIEILLIDPETGQPTATALEDLFYARRRLTQEQSLGSYRDISTRQFCPMCRLVFQLLSNDKRLLPTTSSPAATEGACVIWQHGSTPAELCVAYVTPDPSQSRLRRNLGKIVILSNEYPRPPSPGNFRVLHSRLTEYYLATHPATRSSDLLDIDFVKSCLAGCEHNHTVCRHAGANEQSPAADIFLINVQEECLEPGTTSDRYLVLSYVWGDASRFYQTCGEDVAALRQPGSLAPSADLFDVPETVRDAMTLTRRLGEKYLWVDALCIIQDDSEHKAKQLRMMDRIYRHAVMTVVAMSAQDARSGLPGIGTSTGCPRRKRIMPIESIQPCDPGYSLTIVPPGLKGVIHLSTWSTRAWTFQEQFLSRRCLYLSDWQAYFQCQGTWVVEECARPQDIVSAFEQHNDEYWRINDQLNLLTGLKTWDEGFDSYQKLVAYYLGRNMSCDYDILNAFEGVAAFMQAQLGRRLFAGIPEAVIDFCLLWAPVSDITRRRLPGFNFPSWSWAGWIGKANQTWNIGFLWDTLGIGLGHVSKGYLPYWPEVLRSEIDAMLLEVDGALVEVNRIVNTMTTTANQDGLKLLTATAKLGGHQHLLHFLAETASTRGFSVTGGQVIDSRQVPFDEGETIQPATRLFDASGVARGVVFDKERNCVWDFDDDDRYGFVLLSRALGDESSAPSCVRDLVKSSGGMRHVLAGEGYGRAGWGVCFALLVEWQGGSRSRCQRLAVCQISAWEWEEAHKERRYIQLG